ncbi:protoporphyrinogen oxidase [Lederbergia citrea]|uniref:Coproporphyrinogen III oxidase n=1 Tax=Lederbergia citrea TaxID=2833581 RepID=A0A942ULR2_9BACI|nr:protoporphyrinogen oxidase [Lederbergia citrea]MBS4177496.1 protoporphyrinogen oxidase [Lederbergia citrea]MBS4204169.1 protoporphyrinogen oxidase [Lederbergia citrea]MBS4221246.1 protoporphyrinogen oxidase [Lederbergia citrea]
MKEQKKKVVVIGGGITGLTAAYYLQKEYANQNQLVDVTLVEASHKLGGKIQTVYKDGFIIEKGPDSFLERKTSAAELAKDVGLENDLVNNTAGRAFVLVKDKLHPMPKGAVMGIPTKLGPFVTTDLFSVQGKMRAVGDFIMPRSKTEGDQSLGDFFRRRLGDEVVENLIEPLLSGIYAGDIDQLSLMSTFPQFYQVERDHRSLILGMKKTTPQAPKNRLNSKNQGIFLTLKGGLESLVDAIEDKMSPGSVMKGTRVLSVEKNNDAYEVSLNNGETLQADSIVVALPHLALADLFPEHEFLSNFKEMPATSVATVAMAFDAEEIEDKLDGTGFVVSRNSDYTITACTWTHKKWPHTTPEGKVLLRCYVGRAGEETVVDLSDAEIEKIVLDDLKETMNILATPEFTIVTRWKNAMPQYTVGHQERVKTMKAQVGANMPGVFVIGSSFEGLGLPDCIDQGKAAVEEVIEYLQ